VYSSGECAGGSVPPATRLELVLVPIITRVLRCGRGPAGLTAWLIRRAASRALLLRRRWDDQERRLVRLVARELAGVIGRGLPGAVTHQVGETVRPEELRV
jgi:hypothetical protein